ncbi:MAG: hypothetical protein APF84_14105 [Gracilibacter sp. BRH_c7a]|nr:MAG: hypothetical protein APF84_14105 [Gracilibacter sp. BRH_c7a]
MRPVIVIILGFSILIAVSITTSHYINNASEVLQVELMATEELILSEQWEQALLRIEEMQKKWPEYHDWWAVFLNHSILNTIEISLSKLQQFTIAEDQALSLAELHSLLSHFRGISDSALVKLYNIF